MNQQIKSQIETQICARLLGLVVPTNLGGRAGRAIETFLKSIGVPITNGSGSDFTIQVTILGITYHIEVKSRDTTAISPHTVGVINILDIKKPYEQSTLWQKLQYQIRVTTENNMVIAAELYDLTIPHIQDKFKKGYDYGVQQIIANPNISTTHIDGHWVYFEKHSTGKNSFQLRLSKDDMPAIERMAKSTYQSLFEETTI
jgi:hypothetical protein